MNKILFSERLSDLRRKRGYRSQYALAKAYDEKFPPKRRDEAAGNDGNFGGVFGTIKNYENPNHSGGPKLSVVCNLCEMLDCDIDYLLGKINTPKHDAADVMAVTGLSSLAVEQLRLLSEGVGVSAKGYTISHVSILSKILESGNLFLRTFNELALYLIYGGVLPEDAYTNAESELSLNEYERFRRWANGRNREIVLRKDVCEMHLQTACDLLKNMLREILEKAREDNG